MLLSCANGALKTDMDAEYISGRSTKAACAGAYCREQLIGFCCVDGATSGKSAKYANEIIAPFVDSEDDRPSEIPS